MNPAHNAATQWRMVPVEPTPEMCQVVAGITYGPSIWFAMLEAAPQPPKTLAQRQAREVMNPGFGSAMQSGQVGQSYAATAGLSIAQTSRKTAENEAKRVSSAPPPAATSSDAKREGYAPCPTCNQYSHSIGEDRLAEAFRHFQSMIAHPVRGHPMGHAFDEQTRDAAQVLMAAARAGGDGWPTDADRGPRPNCTTIATVPQLLTWLSELNRGDWSWTRNTRCKYVTIRIDTRSGAHSLGDRDGNDLTLDDLTWQYGRSAAPDAEVL